MKRFIRNASIYLLLMLMIAAVIFSLNYYYGQQLSQDIEAELREIAVENNYRLRYIEIESNPLLQRINLQNLNLIKADKFNLIINQAELTFSWQQILDYIRTGEFELDREFQSQITQINYSNLQDNYQLNFTDSSLDYRGGLNLEDFNKPELLLEKNHNFDFSARELKYDFPYYRSYGLNNENWNSLSTFKDFEMLFDYTAENNQLNIDYFNLNSEFLSLVFDLESEVDYEEEFRLKDFKSNFDFILVGEEINFEKHSLFENVSFKQFDFNGYLDLIIEEERYNANQADLKLNLEEFKLLLSEEISQQINENTFGILAQNDEFEIAIDLLNIDQQYTYPNGESNAELRSSIIDAFLEAEFNYSEEIPYISRAELRYKPITQGAKQLNSFLQLVFSQQFTQDEDDYYLIEFWGDINDLNFE